MTRSTSRDGVVVVRRGDTLYSIARANGVKVSLLMAENDLRGSSIRVGQKLYIPGASGRTQQSEPSWSPPETGSDTTYRTRTTPSDEVDVPTSNDLASSQTYRVRSGDSLYGIARRHGVKVSRLAAINSIDDPTKLRVGQVLRVPDTGAGGYDRVASIAPSNTYTQPRVKRTPEPALTYAERAEDTLVGERQREREVAALDTQSLNDTGAVDDGDGRFGWPVKGRIITGFGRRADGTHNDGINIAVPQGTSVRAVGDGVVAYAGSELKGYGNLVLIRHDDNWVSAYAHNSELLVSRGDKIRRGAVIAKAGAHRNRGPAPAALRAAAGLKTGQSSATSGEQLIAFALQGRAENKQQHKASACSRGFF